MPRQLGVPTFKKNSPAAGWFLLLISFGLLIRFLTAATTYGTNDVDTWHRFGHEVSRDGLAAAYAEDGGLNHPPLPALYAKWAEEMSINERSPRLAFSLLLKLPAILADIISCILLYRIGSTHSHLSGLLAAAAMAWNPDSILVSSYHGNTDSIYAMLSLAAAFAMTELRSASFSGVLFGAALNVKLLPITMFFPLAALCQSASELLLFSGGVFFAATPFAVTIFLAGKPFLRDVFGYNSIPSRWGVPYMLSAIADDSSALNPAVMVLQQLYREFGGWLILAVAAILSLLYRPLALRSKNAAYIFMTLAPIVFLTLAPGFGVQYTVFAVPLLIAASPFHGAVYGLLSGIFIGVAYAAFLTPESPLFSNFIGKCFSHSVANVGIVVWAYLLYIGLRFRQILLGYRTGVSNPSRVSPRSNKRHRDIFRSPVERQA